MNSLLFDPVVWISAGVVLFGIIGFFWGVSRLRKLSSGAVEDPLLDSLSGTAPDLGGPVFRPPLAVTPSASPPLAGVSRDVAERLESMTQRLAEMQSVLTKQAVGAGAPGAAPAGGVGQGFSPETIDKLLKIVGNVIQQVDILQKSLNIPK